MQQDDGKQSNVFQNVPREGLIAAGARVDFNQSDQKPRPVENNLNASKIKQVKRTAPGPCHSFPSLSRKVPKLATRKLPAVSGI
jgi:hypothetical protein